MFTNRRHRTGLALLLSLVMLLSLGAGAFAGDAGKFTPGVYTAAAPGFGGDVEVEVTVTADEITDVKVLSHTETEGVGTTAIEKLPGSIVEAQTLKLDAVAGATITSEAILAAAATALAAAGASEDVIYAEPAGAGAGEAEAETLETDVLIIGAGASGLTAAMSTYQNGIEDVIVIEKMPAVGGATSTAGGGMQVYREDEDPEVTEANIEELFLYWCRTGKFTNNARLTMLAARLSTPTFHWLEENGIGMEYEIHEEEATIHASTTGRAAGAINTLYEKVQELGIPVMLETRANHFIMDGNRVIGVEATGSAGQPMTILAQNVLLATGGYGNNPDLIPDSVQNVIYYGPVCPTGDGHIMAKEIGIPMFNMDKVATKHFGVETSPGYGVHIHGAVARIFSSTGAFAVNKEGVRVVNEGGDELDIALASMHQSSDGRLYIVMDQAAYDAFSEVLIEWNTFSQEDLDRFIEENGSGVTKLVKNDTLEGAAEVLGLDVAAVVQSAADFNAGVAAGEDAFGRTGIQEFGEGPYYIMQTVARFATSLGGVNVTDNLEVLDINEEPVPGLFAAGEVVGNVNGSYAHYLIWCFGAGKHFGDVIPAYMQ